MLKEAHRLKEEFFAVYDAPDRKEAEDRYDAWIKTVPEALLPFYGELIRSVTNWRHEIFNYFDVQPRVTNAFTESANALIRTILRDGRGYSFPVLRAKVLYSKRKTFGLARHGFVSGGSGAGNFGAHDLGADISTLMEEYGVIPELT